MVQIIYICISGPQSIELNSSHSKWYHFLVYLPVCTMVACIFQNRGIGPFDLIQYFGMQACHLLIKKVSIYLMETWRVFMVTFWLTGCGRSDILKFIELEHKKPSISQNTCSGTQMLHTKKPKPQERQLVGSLVHRSVLPSENWPNQLSNLWLVYLECASQSNLQMLLVPAFIRLKLRETFQVRDFQLSSTSWQNHGGYNKRLFKH